MVSKVTAKKALGLLLGGVRVLKASQARRALILEIQVEISLGELTKERPTADVRICEEMCALKRIRRMSPQDRMDAFEHYERRISCDGADAERSALWAARIVNVMEMSNEESAQ